PRSRVCVTVDQIDVARSRRRRARQRAPSPATGARLTSCEMLVHGSDRDRALAHRFGDAFDGTVTHVTHREYAGTLVSKGKGGRSISHASGGGSRPVNTKP